jgi:hypothetical protein
MRGKVRRAKRFRESVVCACPKGETADLSTPLRSPGFPVELDGVGALHAAFLNESRTRGHIQRCVAGNLGPVEMTILLFETNLSSRPELSWAFGPRKVMKTPATAFHRKVALSFVIPSEAEGSAVPRTFPGNVFRQSVPGFPATQHRTWPRVRLSVRKAA